MELPLGCSYGQGRYTYEADASTAHEPEAAAGADDLRPAHVGVTDEKYKRNVLRHSFGSYRMEMVKNAGQVQREKVNLFLGRFATQLVNRVATSERSLGLPAANGERRSHAQEY